MSYSPETRALAVLQALKVQPATKAASGRYLRSLPIRPGIRYWATSQLRLQQDFVGVQFFGEGLEAARRCGQRLERAGFRQRSPQTGQSTFARPVAFAAGQAIDAAAVEAAKRELDEILRDDERGGAQPASPSFRAFMLSSPLSGVDLTLPERENTWRQGDL